MRSCHGRARLGNALVRIFSNLLAHPFAEGKPALEIRQRLISFRVAVRKREEVSEHKAAAGHDVVYFGLENVETSCEVNGSRSAALLCTFGEMAMAWAWSWLWRLLWRPYRKSKRPSPVQTDVADVS